MRHVVAALVLAASVVTLDLVSAGTVAASHLKEHRVRAGDTLFGIAGRYAVTVPSLMAVNGLKTATAQLRVGSRLAIPQHAVVPTTATRSATTVRRSSAVRTSPAIASARSDTRPMPRVRRAALVATPPASLVLTVPEFIDASPGFGWPVEGMVTSNFGRRRAGWHRGIDILAPPGAAVHAAAPGLVIASDVEDRYGRVVKIAHDDGFVTVYAHNEHNLVDLGDWVVAGQQIATVGRTGHATREHVHFEIRHDGRVYNPLYLLPLPPRLVQVGDHDGGEPNDDE